MIVRTLGVVYVSFHHKNNTMAVTRDWIPKQIHKFKVFADNLCRRVSKNVDTWQLDVDEAAELLS